MEVSNSQLIKALNTDIAELKPVERIAKHSEKETFSMMLVQAVDHVNQLQSDAGKLINQFELGNENIRLADVKIVGEKAAIATVATQAVRDKAIDAFKEIMNLQF